MFAEEHVCVDRELIQVHFSEKKTFIYLGQMGNITFIVKLQKDWIESV